MSKVSAVRIETLTGSLSSLFCRSHPFRIRAYDFGIMEGRTLIFYEFSRSKVERCDFSHFLGAYSLERLPTGRRLRAMMDTFIFGIAGWDQDPREIHMIPEVRRFYRAFNAAWPYWFYFCNLDQDGLKSMVFSCLDMEAIQSDKEPAKVMIQPDKLEFVRFLAHNLGTMNVICDRAQMFETRIYDRSKAVFEYFGLPYEAERPPEPDNDEPSQG